MLFTLALSWAAAIPAISQDEDGLMADPGISEITPPDLTALAGYWKFNENSGTTASDSSGKNNHGTLHGALLIDSELNEYFDYPINTSNALWFDGFNDYLEVPDSSTLTLFTQHS
jgi:hypothetical protein